MDASKGEQGGRWGGNASKERAARLACCAANQARALSTSAHTSSVSNPVFPLVQNAKQRGWTVDNEAADSKDNHQVIAFHPHGQNFMIRNARCVVYTGCGVCTAEVQYLTCQPASAHVVLHRLGGHMRRMYVCRTGTQTTPLLAIGRVTTHIAWVIRQRLHNSFPQHLR